MSQERTTDRLDLTDLLEISDLLLHNQTFGFRVASWSMYPTLCKGDRLTVEPVSPAQIQVGELVLFHHQFPQGLRLLCHRLIAVDETHGDRQLVTKGDAVTGCGETIQPEQILGKVVAVERRWPWSRSGGWVGALARRIDQAAERLTLFLAQWLQSIQKLRGYRWIMRNLLSRCVVVYLGVSEGTRWFRYQPISHGGDTTLPTGHEDIHLLAKLGETCAGSLKGKAGTEGYWIEHLHVRIRFRGLGVGSHLLALAASAASRTGSRVLLASVEPANTAALHLFTKAGFRKTGCLHGNEVSLRRDL